MLTSTCRKGSTVLLLYAGNNNREPIRRGQICDSRAQTDRTNGRLRSVVSSVVHCLTSSTQAGHAHTEVDPAPPSMRDPSPCPCPLKLGRASSLHCPHDGILPVDRNPCGWPGPASTETCYSSDPRTWWPHPLILHVDATCTLVDQSPIPRRDPGLGHQS